MYKYPFDIDQSVLNTFCAAPHALALSFQVSPRWGIGSCISLTFLHCNVQHPAKLNITALVERIEFNTLSILGGNYIINSVPKSGGSTTIVVLFRLLQIRTVRISWPA
jgi:hypothetical protein